jgi:ABC-type nitrate/sulfonate/bicarbonate transport system permease component
MSQFHLFKFRYHALARDRVQPQASLRSERAVGRRSSLDGLAIFIILVLGWELIVQLGLMPGNLLPPPSGIVMDLILNKVPDASFWVRVLLSFATLNGGILFALILATPLAVIAGLSRRMDSCMTPMVTILGSLPDIAILPILVRWFGPGMAVAILISSLCAFFPVFFAVREGVREIPAELLRVTEIFGSNRFDLLRSLIFPATFPKMVTGLRVAYDFVWEIVLAIEIFSGLAGLGHLIQISSEMNNMVTAFSSVLVIALMSVMVDRLIFARLETGMKRWLD